jgi:hypothetical protein
MNRAPTDTRDVVDLDATLGEQFLDVALRQPEAQLPTDSRDDHSGGNRKPAKADGGTGPGEGEFSCRQCHHPGAVTANATVPSRRS